MYTGTCPDVKGQSPNDLWTVNRASKLVTVTSVSTMAAAHGTDTMMRF